MSKFLRLCLLLTGWLLLGSLSAQSTDPPTLDQETLTAELRTLFTGLAENNRFLCQVVATRGGEEIFSFASNQEDFVTNRPVSEDTRYNIGSVSKVFTAAAIQVLIQEGKLTLEDRVSELLPALAGYPEVRVRHLLFHTSGLPFGSAYLRKEVGVADGDVLTYADLLSWMESEPIEPLFAPGTDVSYSNVGYMLLGGIIEQTSGQTYGAFLGEHVFAPLGLTTAEVRQSVPLDAPAGYAIPYTVKEKKHKVKPYSYHGIGEEYSQPRVTYGPSGVYMSVRDLLKIRELWTTDVVMNAASRTALTELEELEDGKKNFWRYGGIRDRVTSLDAVVLRMAGDVPGFVSQVIYVPKYDLTIAACTNYYILYNKYSVSDDMIDLTAVFKPMLIEAAAPKE